MNRKDFITSWMNKPNMKPAFIMVKDVPRMNGTLVFKRGTNVYGVDDRNSFHAITGDNYGNVSLPINSVKFVGYVDINQTFIHILGQFRTLLRNLRNQSK